MTELRANRLADFADLAEEMSRTAARVPCSVREYVEGLNIIIGTLAQDQDAARRIMGDVRVDTLDGRESKT